MTPNQTFLSVLLPQSPSKWIRIFWFVWGLIMASTIAATVVGTSVRDEYGVSVLNYTTTPARQESTFATAAPAEAYRWNKPGDISEGRIIASQEFTPTIVAINAWFLMSVTFYLLYAMCTAIWLVFRSSELFGATVAAGASAVVLKQGAKLLNEGRPKEAVNNLGSVFMILAMIPISFCWLFVVVAIPFIFLAYHFSPLKKLMHEMLDTQKTT